MVMRGHCLMQQVRSAPVNARRLAGDEPGGREVGACPLGQPLAVPKPCRLHGAIGLLIAPSLLWNLIALPTLACDRSGAPQAAALRRDM